MFTLPNGDTIWWSAVILSPSLSFLTWYMKQTRATSHYYLYMHVVCITVYVRTQVFPFMKWKRPGLPGWEQMLLGTHNDMDNGIGKFQYYTEYNLFWSIQYPSETRETLSMWRHALYIVWVRWNACEHMATERSLDRSEPGFFQDCMKKWEMKKPLG